jgi:prepilin-type processing-associated H-X9-DG protein
MAAAGLVTYGISALIAIPIAVWAVISGRRRGIQPFSVGMAVITGVAAVLSLYLVSGLIYARKVGLDRDAQSECLNNLKQINLAAMLYAEDHRGHAPPPGHWIEALKPYTKGPVFQCPVAKSGTVGYAYNPGVAGLNWQKLPEAIKFVTFFDGTPGWDMVGGIGAIAPRHRAGPPDVAVFAFADGHVKSATPLDAKRFRWRATGAARTPSSRAASTRH